ncbi:hypothetical protein V8E53_000491 [Lactarius tabidus]
MTEFSLSDFLDIEAVVDNEEEDEDEEDEQELTKFLDDDIEESESGRERLRSVTLSELSDEATDMLACATARGVNKAPRPKDDDGQHLLLPAKGNPEMWAVCIKRAHNTDRDPVSNWEFIWTTNYHISIRLPQHSGIPIHRRSMS